MKKLLIIVMLFAAVSAFAQEAEEPTVEELEAYIEQLEAQNDEISRAYEDLFMQFEILRRETETNEITRPRYIYVTRYPLIRTNREMLNPYIMGGVNIDSQTFDVTWSGTVGIELVHRLIIDLSLTNDLVFTTRIGWMF